MALLPEASLATRRFRNSYATSCSGWLSRPFRWPRTLFDAAISVALVMRQRLALFRSARPASSNHSGFGLTAVLVSVCIGASER